MEKRLLIAVIVFMVLATIPVIRCFVDIYAKKKYGLPTEGEVVELVASSLTNLAGQQNYVVAIRGKNKKGDIDVVRYDVSKEIFETLKIGDYYKHNPEN